MLRRPLIAVTSVTLALCVCAGPAMAAPENPAENRINAKLAKRLTDARLGRDVSVVVLDSATGRLVFSRRAEDRQLPASNMKVLTAMAALATLGPDTRFSTRVISFGPGDIVLQGGGDPLLRRSQLRQLADQAATSMTPGQPVTVHVDISRFGPPRRPGGWPREYVPSVVSPVSALALYGDYRVDPTGHAAEVFIGRLRELGLTAMRGADASAPAGAPVIAQADSQPVGDAVAVMLRDSENNIAEVLFRQVAIAGGQPGSWEGARAVTSGVLAALGVDTRGMRIDDGSGLSRRNRLTALGLSTALRLSRTDPRFASMYVEWAMPTAGLSGTLDDRYGRFSTTPSQCARGLARAKTGTLRDTIGLSGIATGADGQEKVFSILVNDRPQRVSPLATRQAVDGLVATITGCW